MGASFERNQATFTTAMTPEPISQPHHILRQGPGSLIAGATYPIRALGILIKYPKCRTYIIVPIVINLLVGITLYAGVLFAGFRLIDAIIADIPIWTAQATHGAIALPTGQIHLSDWLHHPSITFPHWQFNAPEWLPHTLSGRLHFPDWLRVLPHWGALLLVGVLRLLLTLILFLLTGFILLQFGVLLGAPWYGKLSEELERLRTGQVTTIEVGVAQDIGRAVLYELKKVVFAVGGGLLLLLLGFLPGLGTLIGSIGGVAIATTLVCLDFLDSPLERRRLRFRQKLGIVWRSLPASGSFGLVCLGLVSIPLLNLLAIPICVAAGTLFACDRVLPWLQPPGS